MRQLFVLGCLVFHLSECCISTANTSTPSTATTTTTTTTQSCMFTCPTGQFPYTNTLGQTHCFLRLDGPTGSCGVETGCNGFQMGCTQAATACASLGGSLASIHDSGENAFVLNLSGAGGSITITGTCPANAQCQETCIGLSPITAASATAMAPPSTNPSDWQWSDGSAYNYQNWLPAGGGNTQGAAPNNFYGNEGCAVMYSSVTFINLEGYWDDDPCNTVRNHSLVR